MSSPESSSLRTTSPRPYRNPQTKKPEWTVGDITLTSGDGYSFKVQKIVLQFQSLTFEDMFDIPLAESVIALEESSEVINSLLYLMHKLKMPIPRREEHPDKHFASLVDVLKASQKYQLHRLLDIVRDHLINQVKKWDDLAFIGFAFGCKEGWEELCKASLTNFGDLSSGGEPWNWSTKQMKQVGFRRFSDFLVAFSEGRLEADATTEETVGDVSIDWDSVAEAFVLSG